MPSFEVITSGQTYLFVADKDDKFDRTGSISVWIEKIRGVCDTLVLSSIGGGGLGRENSNILSRSYSKVSLD